MAVLLAAATQLPAVQPGGAPAPVPPAGATAAPADLALAALKQLEPGLWQLDVQGRASRTMCVAEPSGLVQIEHEQTGCTRFVIANEPKTATVHYSCQRTGWGRTTVRVDTPRSAVIQTQGIARNAPFDYLVQARRVGTCGGQAEAKPR
jgi:hypothetical protein